MKPFYASPEAVLRLQFHAGEWLGTPFMPNAAVKGAGVSCQQLVGAIYRETHFLPPTFVIPEGPMNWGHAHTESLIAAFLAAQPNFLPVPAPSLQPGDLLGFRLGGCIHHCGLVVSHEGKFIHCLRGQGTLLSSVRDASYRSRLGQVWRPIIL